MLHKKRLKNRWKKQKWRKNDLIELKKATNLGVWITAHFIEAEFDAEIKVQIAVLSNGFFAFQRYGICSYSPLDSIYSKTTKSYLVWNVDYACDHKRAGMDAGERSQHPQASLFTPVIQGHH